MNISEAAMLVSMSISTWSARRYDRNVSLEVDRTHGAKDGGRFNKLLIDKAALAPIEQIEGQARKTFYEMTYAWADNGSRLLPAAMYMKFGAEMRKHRNAFEVAVDRFVRDYPTLKAEARQRLGTMYNADDYPLDIRERFAFPPIASFPVPRGDDFRVAMSDEAAKAIREDIENRTKAMLDDVTKQCHDRLVEHLTRIRDRCSEPKARIFDSLLEAPAEFVEALPMMNLTNDQRITDAGNDLKRLLASVSVAQLRKSTTTRHATADAAANILKGL